MSRLPAGGVERILELQMAHSLDLSGRMAWITGGSDVWGKPFVKTLAQARLAVVQIGGVAV